MEFSEYGCLKSNDKFFKRFFGVYKEKIHAQAINMCSFKMKISSTTKQQLTPCVGCVN